MLRLGQRFVLVLIGLLLWVTPALAEGPTSYTVQRGDTLALIAKRHGTNVATLMRVNGINNPNRLYPGQRLQMPGSATTSNLAPIISTDDYLANPTTTGAASTTATWSVQPTGQGQVGAPVRIVASKIGLDTRIIPVGWKTVWRNGKQDSEWIVADYAAGWHSNSARAGEVGNTVISGHHNIKGEVFRWLVKLAVGDQLTLYTANGSAFTYEVSQTHILPDRDQPLAVRQQNARWIASTDDNRLTLVTCWPYTDNTHRLVVVARPVN
jgi:LPXTG-site transpeptidase (sortase) family protein